MNLRSCQSCGVLEVFAVLRWSPPVYIVSHPIHNRSHLGFWLCENEYDCVRRSRAWLMPGRGLRWGYEIIDHALIQCRECGEERTAQGVREKWVDADPMSELAYVCSQCGAEHARVKWVFLEKLP